jgi:hypothetical protein
MDARLRIRRTLIEVSRRRARPGTGSALNFLWERTANMLFPDLGPVLGPIPWAVVGAAATRLYMPERATQDLDVMVRPEDAALARQRLIEAGFTYQGELAIGGSSWRTPEGFPVDVVEQPEPWLVPGIEEAERNRDPQGLPVLPFPYLVLMKLRSGRVQDLADVTRMLGQANEEMLAAVRELCDRVAPGEREDLESLIALGRLEMQNHPS